jgi:hypothetical protein
LKDFLVILMTFSLEHGNEETVFGLHHVLADLPSIVFWRRNFIQPLFLRFTDGRERFIDTYMDHASLDGQTHQFQNNKIL